MYHYVENENIKITSLTKKERNFKSFSFKIVYFLFKHLRMVKNKEDKSIKGTSGSGTQKPAKGNDSKNLLSQFWSLASFNEDERVNSVLNILKELEASENKVR